VPARAGLRWFALLLVAACVLLGFHGCRDRGDAMPASTPGDATRPPVASAAGVADPPADTARTDAIAAIQDAVSMLQAYIAALPEDRARADAFWIGGAPAAVAREADLRQLPAPPRAVRVRTAAPRILDAADVPTALEIDVELRLHMAASPPQGYAGWYRLHRDGDGGWRIADAAIDALPPPR
jgi:hypothetical protein